MCWQTKKVYILTYEISIIITMIRITIMPMSRKMFNPAPLDTIGSENPSPYENPYLSLSSLCFLCHYLCTPVSPWVRHYPVHPVIPCQALHTSPVINFRVRHWHPPYIYPMNDLLLLIKAVSGFFHINIIYQFNYLMHMCSCIWFEL